MARNHVLFGLCTSGSHDKIICLSKSQKEQAEGKAEERENLWSKTNMNAIYFILCLLEIHDCFS